MTYLLLFTTNKFKNNSYSKLINYLNSIGNCFSSKMDNNYHTLIKDCNKTFIELKNDVSKILIKEDNEHFVLLEIDIINKYNSFEKDKIYR